MKSFLAAVGLVVCAGSAQAALIDYTLNATFEDSETVTGTFRYDSVAGTAANHNFTLSAFPGASFTQQIFPFQFPTTFEFAVVDAADGPDFSGAPVFDIDITTSGDLLAPLFVGQYGTCVDSFCGTFVRTAFIESGTLVGTRVDAPVPAPATLLLLPGALLALAGLRSARRDTA
ncbi:MAG: hypothetical protein AAF526_03595 [Pseudomonadota bacterium]